jgi:hypothetical protein
MSNDRQYKESEIEHVPEMNENSGTDRFMIFAELTPGPSLLKVVTVEYKIHMREGW